MSVPDLPPLREVIAAHGLSASKSLGQNFLFDEQLLARIAAIPGDLSGRRVLEVGPGPGGLTRALLRAGAQVTARRRSTQGSTRRGCARYGSCCLVRVLLGGST